MIHIVQNAIIHAVFIQGIFIKHLLCSKVIRDSVVNTNRKILYFWEMYILGEDTDNKEINKCISQGRI